MPLMKNVVKLLAKSILILLGLTAATSASDAAIQKKIFGSGLTSNKQMNDKTKIVKYSEELINFIDTRH